METIFESVVDKHMPKMKIRVRQEDRRSICDGRMENGNQEQKEICTIVCPNLENWELKRKQRNFATKDKRRAIKVHWAQKSDELRKRPRDFYKTFKPFLSDKSEEETKIAIKIDE